MAYKLLTACMFFAILHNLCTSSSSRCMECWRLGVQPHVGSYDVLHTKWQRVEWTSYWIHVKYISEYCIDLSLIEHMIELKESNYHDLNSIGLNLIDWVQLNCMDLIWIELNSIELNWNQFIEFNRSELNGIG